MCLYAWNSVGHELGFAPSRCKIQESRSNGAKDLCIKAIFVVACCPYVPVCASAMGHFTRNSNVEHPRLPGITCTARRSVYLRFVIFGLAESQMPRRGFERESGAEGQDSVFSPGSLVSKV